MTDKYCKYSYKQRGRLNRMLKLNYEYIKDDLLLHASLGGKFGRTYKQYRHTTRDIYYKNNLGKLYMEMDEMAKRMISIK